MNIRHLLAAKFAAALDGLADDVSAFADMVRQIQDAQHGDYQNNCAMPLAKKLGKSPKDVAALVISRLDLGDILLPPEVAGPGFINLRLRPEWLAASVASIAADERLGVAPANPAKTYVIDYSSPNVAKPLHVGHLRSSIIGDALTRLLRFQGHTVVTDNHLGDWGTQFGILLYGYKNFRDDAAFAADPVAELLRLYLVVRGKFAKKADDDDDDAGAVDDPVQDACRAETAKLHKGDPENVALWKLFMPACMKEIQAVYDQLGLLPFDRTLGESFYQPMLADVVTDLKAKGIAVESRGAQVIFNGDPEKVTPSIVQKGDGAYTYTATDLATITYRVKEFSPDAVLYVVGTPQTSHFKNLFAAAARWGYDKVSLHHVNFGSVLGEDRKMMATRKGKNVLLEDLVAEAIEAAQVTFDRLLADAKERGEELPEYTDEERREIYRLVGMGALKYADLSQNRASDYVFDSEKMTSTKGNTATYMQYAYARCRAIFRKQDIDPKSVRGVALDLGTTHERQLGLMLLRFSEALEASTADFRPNLLTSYLWDLSQAYSRFYDNCDVLKAETETLKLSRLLLCDLTARTIQRGLDLLGIGTLERM